MSVDLYDFFLETTAFLTRLFCLIPLTVAIHVNGVDLVEGASMLTASRN